MQQLVLQHGAIQAAVSKVLNGLDLVDTFAGVPELDPSRQLIVEGLILSLHAEG